MIVFSDKEFKKTAGQLALTQLPTADMSQYEFPTGPSSHNIVYVAHPLGAKKLIPFAQFNEVVVSDKFNEAVRIMQMLGASEIVSQSQQGDAHSAAVDGRFLKLKGRITRRRGISTATNFRYQGAGSEPEDPSPLRWPQETGFEAARLAVLKNRATMIEIEIESSANFQVDSEVAASIRKLGFGLGVEVKGMKAHSFKITAKFPTKDGPTHTPSTERTQEPPPQPTSKGRSRRFR